MIFILGLLTECSDLERVIMVEYGDSTMLKSCRNTAFEQLSNHFRPRRGCDIHIMYRSSHDFIPHTAANPVSLIASITDTPKHLFARGHHERINLIPLFHQG
ncbi:hypothetical protein D3C72_844390 [compost metagenome]